VALREIWVWRVDMLGNVWERRWWAEIEAVFTLRDSIWVVKLPS